MATMLLFDNKMTVFQATVVLFGDKSIIFITTLLLQHAEIKTVTYPFLQKYN